MRVLLVIMSCVLPLSANAFDTGPLNEAQQKCYGNAMVGYDSVINSRLGVPPEHALDLAKVINVSAKNAPMYEVDVLKTVLGAYLWKDSPHTYAIKVFYECASQNNPTHSASAHFSD